MPSHVRGLTTHAAIFLIAVLCNGQALARQIGTDCDIQTARELEHFDACILVGAQGKVKLSPGLINRVSFDRFGLGVVHAGGFYYVNRGGVMVRTVTFDNGADYFSEGLARSQVDGKIGFVDRRLSTIIAPSHDWASQFERGASIVCDGCVEVREGEYGERKGGKWGAIDRSGRLVLPLRFSGYDEVHAELHRSRSGSR
jgi:hypothetical protein